MNGQSIFTATAKIISGVFYLAVLLGCIAIGVSTFSLITGRQNLSDKKASLTFEVMDFGNKDTASAYRYAPDGKAALQVMPHKFLLHIPYRSVLGYVHYLILLLQFGASLYIIWSLKKIFGNISLKEPFVAKNAVLIRNIGLMLIAIDLVKLFEYLLFGALANDHFTGSNLQLVTSIGNNIWLGLIILALSVVYQRGVEIHSENQLTI